MRNTEAGAAMLMGEGRTKARDAVQIVFARLTAIDQWRERWCMCCCDAASVVVDVAGSCPKLKTALVTVNYLTTTDSLLQMPAKSQQDDEKIESGDLSAQPAIPEGAAESPQAVASSKIARTTPGADGHRQSRCAMHLTVS